VCIFDIRQRSLLQSISLHSSSVNCIAVNDIDGYFVSGSADGDVKVNYVCIMLYYLNLTGWIFITYFNFFF